MVSVLSAGKSLASAITAIAVELNILSGTRLMSIIHIMALPDKRENRQSGSWNTCGIRAKYVRFVQTSKLS